MKKNEIKRLLLLSLTSIIVLVIPIFIFEISIPFMLSLWMTGLTMLILIKRKNPEVVETPRYQLVEKFLYFQIINWIFGFSLFIELFLLAVIVLPLVMIVLALKKERRENPKFIKWSKYIGFHIFNFIVLFVLATINVGDSYIGIEGVMAIPVILFVNGCNAAFYLTIESKFPTGKWRFVILAVALVTMATLTINMFPGG